MALRRPASSERKQGVPAEAGSFDASGYTEWVKTYGSRQSCLEDLGAKVFCKGHAARALKKTGNVTFLACRLRASQPPCHWRAIVRESSDGAAELYQHPSKWLSHNQQSELLGERGFDDIQQRKALSSLLSATATSKPTTALRTARLDPRPEQRVAGAQLRQVQRLKKEITTQLYGCRTMGELREILRGKSKEHADPTKGFFCYSFISAPDDKKPQVTAVATTKSLQQRWASSADCTVSIDGGFKFNLLGWPLHVVGLVNGAGEFGLCALGVTNTMQHDHVLSMLEGFRDSTSKATRVSAAAKKKFAMTDGEEAYRAAMRTVFGAENLMCWFHVKEKAKENFAKHYIGAKDVKEKAWASVAADIDLLHWAASLDDFQSRCAAVHRKWSLEGLVGATTWEDKGGRKYNFVDSFFAQWRDTVPEWYMGAAGCNDAPTTNNGAEACIKNTRGDAGNVVGSIGEVLSFMLAQVEHVSQNDFDPLAERKVASTLWHRALAFKTLFGTDCVRRVTVNDQIFYCCHPRSDPDSLDVCTRDTLSADSAATAARAYFAQVAGEDTTVEGLMKFSGPLGIRVFGVKFNRPFCSCPSFQGPQRNCLHTLGLAVHLGREPPDYVDDALLSLAKRGGNKRKAPSRGSVPILVDQKDARIMELEAALRKAKRQKIQPVVDEPIVVSKVIPLRRCRTKTNEETLSRHAGSSSMKTLVPIAQSSAQTAGGSNHGASAVAPPGAPSETLLWRTLENVFRIPPDVITAMFTGCCQWYGESGALALFNEEWLRDLTDRWIVFSAICQEKRPSDSSDPVLPCVMHEFQHVSFCILRCAKANSKQILALHVSDDDSLASLKVEGYVLFHASGDDNNCLVHTLAIGLEALGFISPLADRRQDCNNVRDVLILSPNLHPRSMSGEKSKTAFLEHGIHADAIVRQLHRRFGVRELPEDGVLLKVHARYDGPDSPPDATVLGASKPVVDARPVDVMHAFNWTGGSASGFHYDALVYRWLDFLHK